MRGAGSEEGFSLPVGKQTCPVGVDHDHRVLDGVEHHAGGVDSPFSATCSICFRSLTRPPFPIPDLFRPRPGLERFGKHPRLHLRLRDVIMAVLTPAQAARAFQDTSRCACGHGGHRHPRRNARSSSGSAQEQWHAVAQSRPGLVGSRKVAADPGRPREARPTMTASAPERRQALNIGARGHVAIGHQRHGHSFADASRSPPNRQSPL
jgi:hypothetical protein